MKNLHSREPLYHLHYRVLYLVTAISHNKACSTSKLTLKNLVALVAYATVTLMSEKCDIFQKSANSRVAHTLRAKHAYFLIQFNIISLLLRIL